MIWEFGDPDKKEPSFRFDPLTGTLTILANSPKWLIALAPAELASGYAYRVTVKPDG